MLYLRLLHRLTHGTGNRACNNMRYILYILFLAVCCGQLSAATYYADAAAGGGGNGSEGSPWNESEMLNIGNTNDGDIVYCKGSFETLDLGNDSFGTTDYVKFIAWSGFTPDCNQLIIRDANYVWLEGWKIDVGWTDIGAQKTINIVNADANPVYIKDCTIKGARRATPNMGDFYPYLFWQYGATEDKLLDLNSDPGSVTVTFDGCDISNFGGGMNLERDDSNITFTHCNMHRSSANYGIQWTGGSFSNNTFIVQDCNFYDFRPQYGKISYPGTETGDWNDVSQYSAVTHESGQSGIWVEIYSSAGTRYFTIVADDLDNVATASSVIHTEGTKWVLDSNNAYFWTHGAGTVQQSHNDCIVWNNDCGSESNYHTIERCYFRECQNDFMKIEAGDQYIEIRNCIMRMGGEGSRALLFGSGGTIKLYNDLIICTDGSNTMLIGSNVEQFHCYNNILSGSGGDSISASSVHADYNIWGAAQGSIDDDVEGAHDLYGQDFTDSPEGNNRYFNAYDSNDFTAYNTSSPQVDSGTDANAPDVDYLSASRPSGVADDIGPYEEQQGGTTYLIAVQE